jgi:hypothetical protein
MLIVKRAHGVTVAKNLKECVLRWIHRCDVWMQTIQRKFVRHLQIRVRQNGCVENIINITRLVSLCML